MSCKVELIPISEGNRIVIKPDEQVIVGRGSSLGCDDKRISRKHAELSFKSDKTLWIKSTHANPVFYRALNGKTIQLKKDMEQQLNDNDQIGLLPASFFFRISFSVDANQQNDELSTSTKQQLHTTANNVNPNQTINTASTLDTSRNIQSTINSSNNSKCEQTNNDIRKLPRWMALPEARTSSLTSEADGSPSNLNNVKRKLDSKQDVKTTTNDHTNTFDITAKPSNSTSSVARSIDSDHDDGFDSIPLKKVKSNGKWRVACPYGTSCYRKNPIHRKEQSHPGDSDYEESNKGSDNSDNDTDKPACSYGKSCYRKNSQHLRDYKH